MDERVAVKVEFTKEFYYEYVMECAKAGVKPGEQLFELMDAWIEEVSAKRQSPLFNKNI